VSKIKKRFLDVALIAGLSVTALAQAPHSAPLRYAPTRATSSGGGIVIDGIEYIPVTELQSRALLISVWQQKD